MSIVSLMNKYFKNVFCIASVCCLLTSTLIAQASFANLDNLESIKADNLDNQEKEDESVLSASELNNMLDSSLVFDKTTIGYIKKSLQAHQQGILISVLLPELFPPKVRIQDSLIKTETATVKEAKSVIKEKKPEFISVDVPSFYLNSIMSFGPNDWIIWLNNKAIKPGDAHKFLEIHEVGKDYVVFIWKNVNMDHVYPDWHRKFTFMSNKKYASNNKNIVLNLENKDVYFILHPNQTLITEFMFVKEGYLPSKNSKRVVSLIEDKNVQAKEVNFTEKEVTNSESELQNLPNNLQDSLFTGIVSKIKEQIEQIK